MPAGFPQPVVVGSSTSQICFQTGVPVSNRFFSFTAPNVATDQMSLSFNPTSGTDASGFPAVPVQILVKGYPVLSSGVSSFPAQTTIPITIQPAGIPASLGPITFRLSSSDRGFFQPSTLTFSDSSYSQVVQYTDYTVVSSTITITATPTNASSAYLLCVSNSINLQVVGFQSPIQLRAPTLIIVNAGGTVAISMAPGVQPYPNGQGSVTILYTLANTGVGDSVSPGSLTWDGSNYNTSQSVTVQSNTLSHNISLIATLAGPNAYQYSILFSPLRIIAAGAVQLQATPTYILTTQYVSVNLVATGTVGPASLCVEATGTTMIPSQACFTTGSVQPVQLLAQGFPGSQSITFTPVSGSDAQLFLPSTVSLHVLGYLVLSPSPVMGTSIGPDGRLNATGQSDLILRLTSVGLPQGDLTVSLSGTASGTFSSQYQSLSIDAYGGGFTDFVYSDGSLQNGPLFLTATITGGSLTAYAYVQATLAINIFGRPAHLTPVWSSAIVAGYVSAGTPQKCQILSSASPPVSPTGQTIDLQISMNCAGSASPSGVSFTVNTWTKPLNFSLTPTQIGQTCTAQVLVLAPFQSSFNPTNVTTTFIVLDSFGIVGMPTYPLAGQVYPLVIKTLSGNIRDVCCELDASNNMYTFDQSVICFSSANQVNVVATAKVDNGPTTLTVTPISGSQMAGFITGSLSTIVLGYVQIFPAPAMNSYIGATGRWNATSQQDILLRITSVALPAGTLQLSLASNLTTGVLSITTTTLTVASDGSGYTDFTFTDGSLKSGIMRITSTVYGGTISGYAYVTATIDFDVLAHPAVATYGMLSAEMSTGHLTVGVSQSASLAITAAPNAGGPSIVITTATTCATSASSFSAKTYTSVNWRTPQSISFTPSQYGQVCTVTATIVAPYDQYFSPNITVFPVMVRDSWQITGCASLDGGGELGEYHHSHAQQCRAGCVWGSHVAARIDVLSRNSLLHDWRCLYYNHYRSCFQPERCEFRHHAVKRTEAGELLRSFRHDSCLGLPHRCCQSVLARTELCSWIRTYYTIPARSQVELRVISYGVPVGDVTLSVAVDSAQGVISTSGRSFHIGPGGTDSFFWLDGSNYNHNVTFTVTVTGGPFASVLQPTASVRLYLPSGATPAPLTLTTPPQPIAVINGAIIPITLLPSAANQTGNDVFTIGVSCTGCSHRCSCHTVGDTHIHSDWCIELVGAAKCEYHCSNRG